MTRTEELAYWINEREYIRQMKEEGDHWLGAPHSADPAMNTVRYCNVHREDDKVTRWIRDNWRNNHADQKSLTYAMVAARMVNWPDTLSEIGYPSDLVFIEEWQKNAMLVIRNRQEKHMKAWTSAYTISTCGKSVPKEFYVFEFVLPQVYYDLDLARFGSAKWTLAEAHSLLTRVDGLGSFLAAQVIADLKNTPRHPLSNAPDFWTWSAPGPGSLRGLEAYFGRHITNSTYHASIEQCYNEVKPLIMPYVEPIHMQDFQNCLCEFSKYVKFKAGGHVRNRYPSR